MANTRTDVPLTDEAGDTLQDENGHDLLAWMGFDRTEIPRNARKRRLAARRIPSLKAS